MNSLLAVFRFEMKRILTPGRAFWWVVVAAFPVVIMLLMTNYIQFPPGARVTQQNISTMFTIALYFVAPTISCMLGALLIAAPAVASELEQHSWVYLAVRPNGLFYLILGKYLVAVVWAASATLVGVTAAVAVADAENQIAAATAMEEQPSVAAHEQQSFRQRYQPYTNATGALPGIVRSSEVLVAMAGLATLSACAYSALYIMLGTVFHRRAMVLCVAYTAGVELFLGFFPAVINRFTIQYRLRTLLFEWTTQSEQFRQSRVLEFVASDESVFAQIMWLTSWIAVFLAITLVSVQVREFTSASETDV
jgi:ABC-type transport system involved in multi-copper enzyme maturation permease subunit